jgi:hypothetical protein
MYHRISHGAPRRSTEQPKAAPVNQTRAQRKEETEEERTQRLLGDAENLCKMLAERGAFDNDDVPHSGAYLVKIRIYEWLKKRELEGRRRETRYLPLWLDKGPDKEFKELYIIEDPEDASPFRLHHMEEQKKLLLSPRRAEAIQGLAALVLEANHPNEDKEGQARPAAPQLRWREQVSAALDPYADPARPLPVGVTETMARFLAHSAGEELWDDLAAQRGERVPELLLGYYLSENSLSELGERAGGISAARASQLIAAGVEFLWDGLPNDWSRWTPDGPPVLVTKEQEYPRDGLRRGRWGRGGVASKESALRRWQEAEPEKRAEWLDRIDQGAHSAAAKEKARQAALKQWERRRMQDARNADDLDDAQDQGPVRRRA